jgi:penicillin-binding protein 1A
MSAPPRTAPSTPAASGAAVVLLPLLVAAVLVAPTLAGNALPASLVELLPARLTALVGSAGPTARIVAGFLLLLPVGSVVTRRTGRAALGVLAGILLAVLCTGVERVVTGGMPPVAEPVTEVLGALLGTALATRTLRRARRRAGGAAPVRRLPRAVIGLVAGALAAVLLLVVATAALLVVTPSVADAQDRVQRLAASRGERTGTAVPAKVEAALLATEDSRYESTPGVDPLGVGRWLIGTVEGRADAGGATIEQQLAKLLYTDGHQQPVDQAEQVGLALKLDRAYTKERILRMYLTTAYFGHGYYGVEDAARGYFGTTPGRLDWAQAALLAGLVQAPSAYDPVVHPALATSRRGHVLDRLVSTHAITAAQAAAIDRSGLGLAPRG